MKESTGLKDRNGREICVGDNVEFWVRYDHNKRPTYCTETNPDPAEFTQMRDKVIKHNAEYFFWNGDVQGGALARRHASFCTVIPQ